MRIALTLDPDVASRLDRFREEHKGTLESVAGHVLCAELDQLEERSQERPRYEVQPLPLGNLQLANLGDIAETLAFAETNTLE